MVIRGLHIGSAIVIPMPLVRHIGLLIVGVGVERQ